MKKSKTIVIVDYSYVDSQTEEQAKINDARVSEAVWTMCEEAEIPPTNEKQGDDHHDT